MRSSYIHKGFSIKKILGEFVLLPLVFFQNVELLPANVHSRRERLQDETETSALAGMTLIASMSTVWWNSGGSGEIHFAR